MTQDELEAVKQTIVGIGAELKRIGFEREMVMQKREELEFGPSGK